MHVPTEDKSDNTKDSFYGELVHAFNHMKILFRDFNAKVGREYIFKPTIRNESLHEINNHNKVRVVNFATSRNMSRVQCINTATFITTPGLLTGKCTTSLITS
jgi:hypothetical protein